MTGPYRHPDPHDALPQEEKNFLKALQSWDKEAIRNILDENITLIDRKNTAGRTALMFAAMHGDAGMAEWLLERGASISEQDNDGTSVLMWASRSGHGNTTALLLKNGADINARSSNGGTALIAAAWFGAVETVKLLLANGADVDIEANDGLTALQAAQKFHRTVVIALLEKEIENRKQQRLAEQAKKEAQFLEDTDFSKGLKKPVRASRPLGVKP